jgi:hypothetical protein
MPLPPGKQDPQDNLLVRSPVFALAFAVQPLRERDRPLASVGSEVEHQAAPQSPIRFSFIWGRLSLRLETPKNEVYPVGNPSSNQDSSHERGP